VRVPCLEEALAVEAIHMGIERSGMFGGHSPCERNDLVWQRRRAMAV
jgi:hypothetical protein